MLPILAERGYLIPAVNTAQNDYVACASRLAKSIKVWHPDAKVCLLTDNSNVEYDCFDYVQVLPLGDQAPDSDWKLINDWQAGRATPFRQTIKLEADMLITSPIEHWWDMLQKKDVVVSTGCRNFYGQPSTSRFYRKVFDQNNLPDVYNAVTYWRFSETAVEFWRWVRKIFENWNEYKTLLKFPDELPTTDLVYAMVAVIMGPERVTMPWATYPKIVHMKRHIIGSTREDWTRELVWEWDGSLLRINTVAQEGAFHYCQKNWKP